MLYDIPGRTGIAIADETYRAAAAHDRIVAVKDAVGDLYRGVRIMHETGLALYSGDDVINLGWLTHGGCGIVSVVGHVAGVQYAAMVDAVDRGDLASALAIYRELVPVVEAVMTTAQGAMTAKAALELLGVLPTRTVRLPLVPARRGPGRPPARRPRPRRAAHRRRCMSRPAPRPRRPRPAGRQRPAGHPARRARRRRPQHDRLRVRRPAAHRRLRRAVPRGPPPRRRPDPPRLRPDPGPARPGRGPRPDARPRGPHRRDAVPPARAGRHPAGRLAADPGAARPPSCASTGSRRPCSTWSRRATRSSSGRSPGVRRGQPLDPRRARGGDPDRCGHRAAHRRLQDGPAAARRADHRPAGLRPARRGGRRPVHGRLHQRRGARASPPPSSRSARCSTGCSTQPRPADHRGLLRLPHPPGPAGDGRRRRARPQGRVRRTLDGPQHGRRAGAGLPHRAAEHPGRRQGARGLPARADRADLHRLPGRAAVGAVPDRAAHPQLRAHRGGRHRRPGQLA